MHGLSDITIYSRGQTVTKFSCMVSQMIFVHSLKDLEHWISRLVFFVHFTDKFYQLINYKFKVKVEQEAIDYVEQIYAPPDDPVFELVPATFAHYAQMIYDDMGSPTVTGDNIWDIYRGLVQRLEDLQAVMDYAAYLD